MSDKELFIETMEFVTSIVELVAHEDFANETPDEDWTVRDLLEHTLSELYWTCDIVAGKTIEEVGDKYDGDLIAGNLQQSWHTAYENANDSVQSTSTLIVHLSYGDVPLGKYLREAAADQLIHSWDLGEGIGVAVEFPEEIAQAVLDATDPAALRSSGLFAEPIEVPDNAPLQTRLLALYGRTG